MEGWAGPDTSYVVDGTTRNETIKARMLETARDSGYLTGYGQVAAGASFQPTPYAISSWDGQECLVKKKRRDKVCEVGGRKLQLGLEELVGSGATCPKGRWSQHAKCTWIGLDRKQNRYVEG